MYQKAAHAILAGMIEVLPGLEAVRKRPGMYVGNVADGTGLHHLIDEAVNNSLVEAWAGYCKSVQVSLNIDGSATVRDDGRGIPTEMWRDEPIVQMVMTQLHCGGRFRPETGQRPIELGGTGVAVVNALSERLELRVWRDGAEHYMRFARGRVEVPLKVVRDTTEHGTELTFSPDPAIFPLPQFDSNRIERRLHSLAHLHVGATISLVDGRPASSRKVTIDV